MCFIILLLICSVGVQSQLNSFENLYGLEGLKLLFRLDFNVLGLFPTVDEYENFEKHVKKLPLEHIKYLDSIDYSEFDKKPSYIQIYSQDRVYRSNNLYEIAKCENNDSLLITNIQVDMRMKDYIIDLEQYNSLKIEHCDILVKKVKDKPNLKRIIFLKPKISKLLNK